MIFTQNLTTILKIMKLICNSLFSGTLYIIIIIQLTSAFHNDTTYLENQLAVAAKPVDAQDDAQAAADEAGYTNGSSVLDD